MKDLAIYALFKVNQDYLTANNCINRFAPSELCYATCVLEATIQDSQEQNQAPGTLFDQNQKVVYVLDELPKLNLFYPFKQSNQPIQSLTLFSQTFLTDVFQPPEV